MSPDEENVKYTVFIKVPFPRGDFVDPPTANWNATKEAALWKTLNSTPKGAQIDWDELAETFSATPAFLLQQAAWLYERQLSHVREHLQAKPVKAGANASGSGAGGSPGASPAVGSSTITALPGGQAMRRGGSSGGAGSRAPSALSLRAKTSKDFRSDTSGPSTPVQAQARVPYSRTASTSTVTQIQRSPAGAQKVVGAAGTSPRAQRTSNESEGRERQARARSPSPTPGARSNLSSSSSSSSSTGPAQSRLQARRPRFLPSRSKGKGKATQAESDSDVPLSTVSSNDSEEDESPAFLPFSNVNPTASPDKPVQDLAATLRRYSRQAGARPKLTPQQPKPQAQSGSSSGTLSSPPNQQSAASSLPSLSSPGGALRSPNSSHQNSALAALSPRQRRLAQEGTGSEGTPSMGSSFSDLDDASVTHSAMEEALANQMRAGGSKGIGMGSLGVVGRMGGLWRQGSAGAGTATRATAGPSPGASGDKGQRIDVERWKSSK